jgi:outer membrane protein assembly factor BamB
MDTSDGSLLWRFPVGNPTTPAVADGTVYVGGGTDQTIYAIDAETGEKEWEFPAAHRMRLPPTVVDSRVFAPSWFGDKLYALDAADGTEDWSVDMSVSASVAATADAVFVPSADGITILDPEGTERGKATDFDGHTSVVAGETLLVSGESAVCIDLTDGTLLWEQTVEEGIGIHEKVDGVSCEPVVTDDGVFLGTNAGDIHAIGE